MWVVRQLGAPVRYLRIVQGHGWFTSKATYDYVLPSMLAALTTIAVCRFSLSLGLYSEKGFVSGIIDLLNLLIAFFIAALAAVATFDRPGLDDVLKGEPATMRRRMSNGAIRDHVLTHRQFICYLFGYLSFSSVILLITLYAFRLIGPISLSVFNYHLISDYVRVSVGQIVSNIFIYVLFFVLFQICITMLLGIYFLSDRLQFLDHPSD